MSSLDDTLYEHAARMAEREELAIAPSLGQLGSLTDEQRDELDFGVIELDDEGVVLSYNSYESRLTGIDPDEAIGRSFFRDLAPCTNNSLFRGLFERGVTTGQLNHLFPYTFTYRMRPTNVKVHLFRAESTGTNWLLVKRV